MFPLYQKCQKTVWQQKRGGDARTFFAVDEASGEITRMLQVGWFLLAWKCELLGNWTLESVFFQGAGFSSIGVEVFSVPQERCKPKDWSFKIGWTVHAKKIHELY